VSARRPSLAFNLILLFALSAAAVLFALGVVIVHTVEHHFAKQDRELLAGKLALTRHIVEKATRDPADQSLVSELNSALTGHHGLVVHVFGPHRQPIFQNESLDFPPALLEGTPPREATPVLLWQSFDGLPWRGIAASVWGGIDGKTPYTVLIATDTSHHQAFMTEFRITLFAFVAAASLLMAVLGGFVVRRGLGPLRTISQQAAEITAHRLHMRLPVESVPKELADLAGTLNLMLSRLEESFQRLSDFSSDLAHELRTPVSNLLTQTQVTLSRARAVEEYREILGSNIEEFERLSRMISDMLFLAKADNQQIVPHREQVDLAGEVADLLEFYAVLAEEKSVALTAHGAATVTGDRLMLRRAISNLLSNALRHTPAQGRVGVEVEPRPDGSVRLSVTNSGDMIAAEHLPRLFDRFYRVDGSRHRSSEGAGLGLAITRSIIAAHGGTIEASSSATETVFAITLPMLLPLLLAHPSASRTTGNTTPH